MLSPVISAEIYFKLIIKFLKNKWRMKIKIKSKKYFQLPRVQNGVKINIVK